MKKTIEVEITNEEKRIVRALADGDKAENVGDSLGFKPGTFATKLKDIRKKYKVENSTHLVAKFLREGIIS